MSTRIGRPFKRQDIQNCALCGRGLLHNKDFTFQRVTLERFVIDAGAINRQTGLEMMLGGEAYLAHVMGPDEDMAKALGEPDTFLVCGHCGVYNRQSTLEMYENVGNRRASTETPEEQPA